MPMLPEEEVELQQALGRVLAQEVRAPHPLPPFAHSAMDGYAVRSADIKAATKDQPRQLEVIGEAAAGQMPAAKLNEAQAVRITTGAPIPHGADCVVPVEMTSQPEPMGGTELASVVHINEPVERGGHIRPAGLDVNSDELLLPAGQRLRPQDIGLLGAVGLKNPMVRRRPRVAVISTGDEVLEIDRELEPGTIRDANGVMIEAVLQAEGAAPLRLGIASDSRESVRQHLDGAIEQKADLILSTAGVSMGAHDYVRLVVEEQGELNFWRVNVRPGKPLAFGNYRGVPFVGLPGNPVSAWVTAMLFVRPALAAMLGRPQPKPLTLKAHLESEVQSDGRESYLRAVVHPADEGHRVKLTGSQDSAVLSSLVKANCLLLVPAGVKELSAGEEVEIWMMGEEGMLEAKGNID